MKINVISETAYMIKGNGVHTAFVNHVELLNSRKNIHVLVNNEGKGNVMHSHTYGLYYFLRGLRYRNRKVFTVHVIPDSIKGSIPMWKTWMPFVKWYMKQVYSYADVCLAISPRVEEAILETGARTKIVRVYNPIPSEYWKRTDAKRAEGRKMLGVADTDFVVLGVGQLQARKGVEDFMDVAKAIPNAKFVWAGGRPFGAWTEGIQRINHRIEQLQSSNIQFTGMLNLDEMPLVYAAADLMLFPSYQENCPLAPIEAAACGMPVVFRNLPEYASLYESDYLKANNTEEFIQLTNKMMAYPEQLKIGRIISENLIKQFEKEHILNKLINIYHSLSQDKKTENQIVLAGSF